MSVRPFLLMIALLGAGCERSGPAPIATPAGADSAAVLTAPSPPRGYAIETSPAEGGMLTAIQYVTPVDATTVAAYYEARLENAVRIDITDGAAPVIAFALAEDTELTPDVSADVLFDALARRAEPLVVIEPWALDARDRSIRSLRAARQQEQVEALLATRVKVTVVYGQS